MRLDWLNAGLGGNLNVPQVPILFEILDRTIGFYKLRRYFRFSTLWQSYLKSWIHSSWPAANKISWAMIMLIETSINDFFFSLSVTGVVSCLHYLGLSFVVQDKEAKNAFFFSLCQTIIKSCRSSRASISSGRKIASKWMSEGGTAVTAGENQ